MMVAVEFPALAETGAESAPRAAFRMIRADIDLRAFHQWAGSRRMIHRGAFDEGYAMHCLLKESFGERAPKPFRIIAPRDGRKGVLYGYADADADELRELAGCFCDPLQARIIPAESVQSKAMPDEWSAGRRLGFEILVRPVVRSRGIGAKIARGDTVHEAAATCPDYQRGARTIEIDAFQYEGAPLGEGAMNEKERTREKVYSDWLNKRLSRRGGAELEGIALLQSFRRTRAVRKLRGEVSEGPDALMRGTLIVGDDPSEFANLLRCGVGRHRAYGYGMLLLRPPKAPGAG